MAVSRVFVCVLFILAVLFTVLSPSVRAQSISPAPAPVSDGTSVDQGIAYGLMLAALVLTYLIHPMEASPFGLF